MNRINLLLTKHRSTLVPRDAYHARLSGKPSPISTRWRLFGSRHAWRRRSVVENVLIFSLADSGETLRDGFAKLGIGHEQAARRLAADKLTVKRHPIETACRLRCARANLDDQARRECARLYEGDNGYAAKSRSNSDGSNCVPPASVTTTCHPSSAQKCAFATATSKLVLSPVTVSFSLSATIL